MTKRLTAVLLAATLTLVSACSSSGGGSASTPPPSSPASTPAASTPAQTQGSSSTPPSASAPATGSSGADLSAGLLTAADLGAGYAKQPDDNSPESKLPCTPNDPPLFTQVPPQARTEVSFANTANTLTVSQDLAVFADAATAQKAVAVSKAGFACAMGTIDGVQVTIQGRKDAVTGADTADVWDLGSSKFVATAVLLRIGNKLVGLVFVATPSAADSINVPKIIQSASDRAAALG